MDMKMLVVCPCGVRLNVRLAQFVQMRCPKCHLMLAEEIERQAQRNSRAMMEVCGHMHNERLTAKRWTFNDQMIMEILSKHEVESQGGAWPDSLIPKNDGPRPEFFGEVEPPGPHVLPVNDPVSVVGEQLPGAPPPVVDTVEPKKKIRVKMKKNKKGKGRK